MEATPVIARIFTPHEATQLFSHLDQLEIEYHKPYLRFIENHPHNFRIMSDTTITETIYIAKDRMGN